MAVGTAAGELRNLTQEELVTKLRESKEELFNLRFQGATGQLESHGRLRAVRKDIDATGTVQLLRVLDKAEAALDGKFESDAAYEAQERRVRQLVAGDTD